MNFRSFKKLLGFLALFGIFTGWQANSPQFLEIYGQIAQEPEKISEIFAPEPGTIKEIFVKPDQLIYPGTPLCLLLSKDGRKIALDSHMHGLLLARYAKEGDTVDTVTSIMSIANMDFLKASFDAYEKDLQKIQLGQRVIVSSLAYPRKKFRGKIVFISPQVDEETRTLKIRVEIENKKHLLRLGMFLEGKIKISGMENPSKRQLSQAHPKKAVKQTPRWKIIPLSSLKNMSGIISTSKAERKTLDISLDVLGIVADRAILSNARTIECIFDVYEPDIGRVRVGQPVRLEASAFPGLFFGGKVTSISPRVDENTRSIKVVVRAANPNGKIKFGMFLSGSISISQRNVILVPLTAVQELYGRPAVFISHPMKSVMPQFVKLGERSDGWVEIKSGLKEGEEFVDHGGLLLESEFYKKAD